MKKAIVVGGGKQHISVIQILQEYGYYVVLVDFLDDSPAKKVSDKFIHANGFDVDILYRIAKEEKSNIIVNICYDLAMPAVAFVSEKLNLPSPFTFEQSLNNTDKMRMKSIFNRYDIPTSKHLIVDNSQNKISGLSFPVVIKPVDSSGSRGISKAMNLEQCQLAIEYALSQSKTKKVLVEEFLNGDEYQVDCTVCNGNVTVVLAKQKLRFESDDVVSPAGSLIVPDEENNLFSQEIQLANQLAKAFEIYNGVFFFQCIHHDGVLKMIELGVRIGAGFSYKMIKDIKGVDIVRVAVDSWLSKCTPVTPKINNSYYLTNAIYTRQKSVIKSISGFEALLDEKIVDIYDIYVKSEMEIDGKITNKNRLALFMIHSLSKQEIKSKFWHVINTINVSDINLKNIFDNKYYDSWINRIFI